MAQTSSMKLLGARNMTCIVERMEWNNKMDLIAYGTEKGEVVIQRLNWQKIVTFPTPGEDVRVRSLSWQMDETLLAVGYSNGKVALLDAESETIISGLIYDDDIKKVYFSKAINCQETLGSYTCNAKDKHKRFLPKLQPLTNIDPCLKSLDQKSFPKGSPCFLVVIMRSGKVHLLLLGALQAGSIDLTQHVLHPEQFDVYDVRLNGDFNAIYALLRDGLQLKMLHFHNQVLQDCMAPMLELATHCAHILETKNYINDTQQCLTEAWETVQLEMDNKLTKYANSQAYGMISTHFLELHVFGFATFEVEEFLFDTLSEKGFKKIANSVDLSLNNLQGLVFKQLNGAAINMFYFLNTIAGFGRMSHFFESLISPEVAVEAMRSCGAFYLKVHELQRTIDSLVNDMKLFHAWMIFTILRLSHQEIPDEMVLSEEENVALADLLCAMEPDLEEGSDDDEDIECPSGGMPTRSKFNLERVGQYLENACLTQLYPVDPNQLWEQMLAENECLGQCPLFVPHDKKLSLVQQRDKMFNAIDAVFHKPTESISASFKLSTAVVCCQLPPMEPEEEQDFVTCSYYVHEAGRCDMLAVTISWQEAMVLEFSRAEDCLLRCTRVQLLPGPFTPQLHEDYYNLRFVDLQFYNESSLSMLAQSTSSTPGVRPHSYFIQFSLSAARNQSTQHHLAPLMNLPDATVTHSIHDIPEAAAFKGLDGVCEMLAVSGSRKVATVLSDRKRKMTIFEMEIEDEEDDTEMSQASFLEISKESILAINDSDKQD
ncbi:anaphase-promoting complex subunit 4 isoform X1 [Drosophila miranda]|uniref:Anaphase-promoting complex subunit 4 n=1 Tax=Drosophila pseudoobscura pseudoobscura TaxID=46245 RepID=Q29GQ6_DROPS|nr:anaphase-promoting complex subunit 4 isoform X1 [Drosophila pseudoobscura]XP_017146396.1 anaphase-promoting complex subunit 4 isoform X1 [Drosophila miranda]